MATWEPKQVQYAREAGESIRFFLDGGNGAEINSPEDAVCLALSKLNLLMSREEHEALVDAAGYRFVNGPMGAEVLARKPE